MSMDLPERYTMSELTDRQSCALCEKRLGATDGICHTCQNTATIEPIERDGEICPVCGGKLGCDPRRDDACTCGALCNDGFHSTVILSTEENAITLRTDGFPFVLEE